MCMFVSDLSFSVKTMYKLIYDMEYLKPGLLLILPWAIMSSLCIYRGLFLRIICMDSSLVNN